MFAVALLQRLNYEDLAIRLDSAFASGKQPKRCTTGRDSHLWKVDDGSEVEVVASRLNSHI